MPETFDTLTCQVAAGTNLSGDAMTDAINWIMSGQCGEEQIGRFLRALAQKRETAEEVAGAARAMRSHMTPIRHRYERLLDTCGTGGGGSDLFNVSTTAALVIAAAGVPVAKHGNRSITSRSGSADVLAELGVNIQATCEQVERCLDELKVCFCFAPVMHPAMRHVAHVRKQLGIKTIFNILGPLVNPAGATHQLMGAGRPELRPLLAHALQLLEIERAMVVSGEDGLGEVTITGVTHTSVVSKSGVTPSELSPENFGLQRSGLDAARVAGPLESAALVRAVLAGKTGAPRDLVVLNAAAGLVTFDESLQPKDAAQRAAQAIDSGAAADLLARLADMSHR